MCRIAANQAGQHGFIRKLILYPEEFSRSLKVSRLDKLEQLLQDEPQDPFLHYAVAKEMLSTGDIAGGLAKLKDVIGRFPDYVPAHFQHAQSLDEQGRRDEAREAILQGIEVASRVGDTHAEMEMKGFLELLE